MSIIQSSTRFGEWIQVMRVTGRTSSGDPIRGTPETHAARVERQTVDVSSGPDGIVTRGARVFCSAEFALGDLVFLLEDSTSNLSTGRPVLQRQQRVALDGTVVHWTYTL